MEFLDEYESRPKFLFQSKHSPPSDQSTKPTSYISSLHKPTLVISISFSLLILILTFIYLNIEPLKSILLYISLSLFLGPFAPSSLTGGDIRVGLGPPLKEPANTPVENNEKSSRKASKTVKKQPEYPIGFDGVIEKSRNEDKRVNVVEKSEEEGEWSEGDDEMLRKLMTKHPVGKPGRWEAIAEGYKGKHKVESVIMRSKMMGERKASDGDSYQKFLKDRKAVDRRVIEEGENENGGNVDRDEEDGKKESAWSSVEDVALLNALKAFPKEVAMRWEKVAASVPGKTKAACVKRVAVLKKDFRTNKAS